MLSWNSWYNPLDNVASAYKTIAGGFGALATGSQPYRSSSQSNLEATFGRGTSPTTANRAQQNSGAAPAYSSTPTATTTATLDGASGGTGTGTGTGTTYDPDQLAFVDYQMQRIRDGISRIPGQRSIGESNINNSTIEAQNQLAQQRGLAVRDYNTKKSDTGLDYANTRNNIRSQAGSQFTALQRLLGAGGAGRSSAASILAPFAVKQQSSQRFGEVQDTFGRNQRNLDVAFGDTEREYDRLGNELNVTKQRKLNELNSGLAQQELEAQNQLAQLELERQGILGSDARTSLASISPYQGIIDQLLGRIENFGKLYANSVTPTGQVSFNAPTLDAYNFSRFDSPFLQGGANPQGGISPFVSYVNQREEERR